MLRRSLFLAVLVATVGLSAAAAAADPADLDHLATAIDPGYRADGARDDAQHFNGVITFMEPANGRIREIRAFVHGTPDGLYTAYDSNGRLRVQGQTHAGAAVGIWVTYDAAGAVVARMDCDDPKHPLLAATAAAATAPHDGE